MGAVPDPAWERDSVHSYCPAMQMPMCPPAFLSCLSNEHETCSHPVQTGERLRPAAQEVLEAPGGLEAQEEQVERRPAQRELPPPLCRPHNLFHGRVCSHSRSPPSCRLRSRPSRSPRLWPMPLGIAARTIEQAWKSNRSSLTNRPIRLPWGKGQAYSIASSPYEVSLQNSPPWIRPAAAAGYVGTGYRPECPCLPPAWGWNSYSRTASFSAEPRRKPDETREEATSPKNHNRHRLRIPIADGPTKREDATNTRVR